MSFFGQKSAVHPVKTPTRQGFGGKVIRGMIEQIKGRTRFDWHPEGLVCEITLHA